MNHPAALTDLEAVRAFARSRDPRAFEVLLERYQRMVLATCLRVLRDRGHAEDATQETFLKLARHAGEISSNASAWLHRCATRTAIDAQRSLKVRREAEQAVGQSVGRAVQAASDPTERTWREIEPLVDAALERLRDEDRDVLVARFLLGRTQSVMATEASVNSGTMSRRIERALKRLHTELGKDGVDIASVGVLSGAMVLATMTAVPSAEAVASLGKIGLTAGASSGSGTVFKAAVLTIAAVVGAGCITAGMLHFGGGSGGSVSVTSGSSAVHAEGDSVERPRREIAGFTMVHHQVAGPMQPTMECDGQTIELTLPSWNNTTDRLKLRIQNWSRRSDRRGCLTVRTEAMELSQGSRLAVLQDRTFEANYEIDSLGRLQLAAEIQHDETTTTLEWSGISAGGQEDDQAEGRPFVGSWAEVSDWSMRITKDLVEVLSDGYAVYRFKILEWDERTSETRIASICVDSMAPMLVGKRVKLLLRKTDGLYELSFRQWPRERLDEWPEGFEADQENALNVLAFRRAKR